MKSVALEARRPGVWRPVCLAPARWREWTGGGGYYRHLLVQETAGVARRQEVVEAGLERADVRHVAAVRIDRPDCPVPAQIGVRLDEHGRLERVVQFLADVDGRGAARYLLMATSKPSPGQPSTDLKGQGRGLGSPWENRALVLQFDPRSGQLDSVRVRGLAAGGNGSALPLTMRHMGPGYFDGVRAYSPRDWCRPSTVSVHGPVTWTEVREGLLAWQSAVHATVSYTLPAASPYLRVDTLLRFQADVDANTVYDDYCEFDHNTFTQASWREPHGGIGKCCLFLPPEKKRSRHTRRTLVPEGLQWLALASHLSGLAVASLHLAHDCDGWPGRYKARTDLCTGAKGQSWTRFPVHGECDEADERRYREMVPIRAGSVFRESTVYLFCPWRHQSGHETIEGWYQRLTRPLKIADVPL